MNSNRESSYIESLDFLEINVCLTQTIVRLTYLLKKVSYLTLDGIDRILMTEYLLKDIDDLSEFCIKTIEKYFPDHSSHLPDKSIKEQFIYHTNYYFGFIIDGLDFWALNLQKNTNNTDHILEDLVQQSFRNATEMLEAITKILTSPYSIKSSLNYY